MTGLPSRVSRWLVHREPLWLMTCAGAVLDVVAHLVPVVPDAWHPYVTAVVVLLTLLSGRAIVSSPDTVAKLRAQIRPVPPEPTTGPQTPSGVSSANRPPEQPPGTP